MKLGDHLNIDTDLSPTENGKRVSWAPSPKSTKIFKSRAAQMWRKLKWVEDHFYRTIKDQGFCHGMNIYNMKQNAKILSMNELYDKVEGFITAYINGEQAGSFTLFCIESLLDSQENTKSVEREILSIWGSVQEYSDVDKIVTIFSDFFNEKMNPTTHMNFFIRSRDVLNRFINGDAAVNKISAGVLMGQKVQINMIINVIKELFSSSRILQIYEQVITDRIKIQMEQIKNEGFNANTNELDFKLSPAMIRNVQNPFNLHSRLSNHLMKKLNIKLDEENQQCYTTVKHMRIALLYEYEVFRVQSTMKKQNVTVIEIQGNEGDDNNSVLSKMSKFTGLRSSAMPGKLRRQSVCNYNITQKYQSDFQRSMTEKFLEQQKLNFSKINEQECEESSTSSFGTATKSSNITSKFHVFLNDDNLMFYDIDHMLGFPEIPVTKDEKNKLIEDLGLSIATHMIQYDTQYQKVDQIHKKQQQQMKKMRKQTIDHYAKINELKKKTLEDKNADIDSGNLIDEDMDIRVKQMVDNTQFSLQGKKKFRNNPPVKNTLLKNSKEYKAITEPQKEHLRYTPGKFGISKAQLRLEQEKKEEKMKQSVKFKKPSIQIEDAQEAYPEQGGMGFKLFLDKLKTPTKLSKISLSQRTTAPYSLTSRSRSTARASRLMSPNRQQSLNHFDLNMNMSLPQTTRNNKDQTNINERFGLKKMIQQINVHEDRYNQMFGEIEKLQNAIDDPNITAFTLKEANEIDNAFRRAIKDIDFITREYMELKQSDKLNYSYDSVLKFKERLIRQFQDCQKVIGHELPSVKKYTRGHAGRMTSTNAEIQMKLPWIVNNNVDSWQLTAKKSLRKKNRRDTIDSVEIKNNMTNLLQFIQVKKIGPQREETQDTMSQLIDGARDKQPQIDVDSIPDQESISKKSQTQQFLYKRQSSFVQQKSRILYDADE